MRFSRPKTVSSALRSIGKTLGRLGLDFADLYPSPVLWRQALLLLAYLIRNGSERVVTSAREHIYDLRSLENYRFTGQSAPALAAAAAAVFPLLKRVPAPDRRERQRPGHQRASEGQGDGGVCPG